MPHRIAYIASEIAGFAKTGGLADVGAGLCQALANRGHDCRAWMPLYGSIRQGSRHLEDTGLRFTVPIQNRLVQGGLWRSSMAGGNVPVYLVEQPEYFERDDAKLGRGLYQQATADGTRADYPDNCERFVFFCRAVLESLARMDWKPDVFHANDWQCGLVPVYLQELYRHRAGLSLARSLFTIHNLAYQGMFWHWDMHLTGLSWRLFNHRQLEFYGHLNFLKGGIVFSDVATTVSPTYAREIQTPEHGCGLEGVLSERRDRLFGIVNGIDDRVWNPADDPHLPVHYDVNTVQAGKAACKATLQRRFNLPRKPRAPVLGMISRLVEQKGLALIARVAESILREDTQMIFLGEGEPVYERMLRDLGDRYPNQVGLVLGFDEPLAHLIEAGADMFLMPSRYEPSGLNQLYSLRYGTVPLVRATGGLADTITDCTPESLAAHTATGFRFDAYLPQALLSCVVRALGVYHRQADAWLSLIRTGMGQDWSWQRSALAYEKLYDRLVAEPEARFSVLDAAPA
jgi:starch synthase